MAGADHTRDIADAAMKAAVAERRRADPVGGLAVPASEVLSAVFTAVTTERGVHAESAFALLGSLGGAACQAAAFERLASGATPSGLVMLQTQGGGTFFTGDWINGPLLEDRFSLWSLAAGMAQHLGAPRLPDPREIVAHVAATIGADDFGTPRVPAEHAPALGPEAYLRHHLATIGAVGRRYLDDAASQPIVYGLAVQRLMQQASGVLDPGLGLSIVMEYAVPASRIDLRGLHPAA